MSHDFPALCRQHGLTYVETADLRMTRRRCGKGFSYQDANGKTVHDKALREHIASLAIPPAWSDVVIAENKRAHIQAIGRDAEGRLQYRYHPEWDAIRTQIKERRLIRFGSALPKLRRTVSAAISGSASNRTKLVAAVVRLIDLALLRPGYEEYARNGGGRGAATLLKDDITVEDDKVVVEFEGKGGKQITQEFEDRPLANLLRKLIMRRGRRLFATSDGNGGERPITARDVNSFIAKATGVPASAKDFRTFRASAAALQSLAENSESDAQRAQTKAIAHAAEEASQILANTRAVARSSYIQPRIIEAYKQGKLRDHLFRGRVRNGLTKVESALMRFLQGSRSSRGKRR